ncbi:MAG: rhamnulose-1-phosphate aldolase [Bacteroidota bacterium]|jgi:rhamnulose-1-phosphate aldolase|nr:rhamnulose-1-phosphate aldolase [Bacteroidales bacterium]
MSLLIPALKPLLKEVARVAGLLWEKGWAERNAGNISINVSHLIRPIDLISDRKQKHHRVPYCYEHLAGQSILISAAGARMRDLARKPSRYMVLLHIPEGGEDIAVVKFASDTGNLLPSSELPTHLAVHDMLNAIGSEARTVLHAHVSPLIALGHFAELCHKNNINRTLLAMHPETIFFLNKGIGYVPLVLPGSEDLARLTASEFRDHSVVIWEKHGALSTATSPTEAFDLLDILAKSASIYLQCREAGFEPHGITIYTLKEFYKAYGFEGPLPFQVIDE